MQNTLHIERDVRLTQTGLGFEPKAPHAITVEQDFIEAADMSIPSTSAEPDTSWRGLQMGNNTSGSNGDFLSSVYRSWNGDFTPDPNDFGSLWEEAANLGEGGGLLKMMQNGSGSDSGQQQGVGTERDADRQGAIASEILHESSSCAAMKGWDMEGFDGQPWCLPDDKSMQGYLRSRGSTAAGMKDALMDLDSVDVAQLTEKQQSALGLSASEQMNAGAAVSQGSNFRVEHQAQPPPRPQQQLLQSNNMMMGSSPGGSSWPQQQFDAAAEQQLQAMSMQHQHLQNMQAMQQQAWQQQQMLQGRSHLDMNVGLHGYLQQQQQQACSEMMNQAPLMTQPAPMHPPPPPYDLSSASQLMDVLAAGHLWHGQHQLSSEPYQHLAAACPAGSTQLQHAADPASGLQGHAGDSSGAHHSADVKPILKISSALPELSYRKNETEQVEFSTKACPGSSPRASLAGGQIDTPHCLQQHAAAMSHSETEKLSGLQQQMQVNVKIQEMQQQMKVLQQQQQQQQQHVKQEHQLTGLQQEHGQCNQAEIQQQQKQASMVPPLNNQQYAQEQQYAMAQQQMQYQMHAASQHHQRMQYAQQQQHNLLDAQPQQQLQMLGLQQQVHQLQQHLLGQNHGSAAGPHQMSSSTPQQMWQQQQQQQQQQQGVTQGYGSMMPAHSQQQVGGPGVMNNPYAAGVSGGGYNLMQGVVPALLPQMLMLQAQLLQQQQQQQQQAAAAAWGGHSVPGGLGAMQGWSCGMANSSGQPTTQMQAITDPHSDAAGHVGFVAGGGMNLGQRQLAAEPAASAAATHASGPTVSNSSLAAHLVPPERHQPPQGAPGRPFMDMTSGHSTGGIHIKQEPGMQEEHPSMSAAAGSTIQAQSPQPSPVNAGPSQPAATAGGVNHTVGALTTADRSGSNRISSELGNNVRSSAHNSQQGNAYMQQQQGMMHFQGMMNNVAAQNHSHLLNNMMQQQYAAGFSGGLQPPLMFPANMMMGALPHPSPGQLQGAPWGTPYQQQQQAPATSQTASGPPQGSTTFHHPAMMMTHQGLSPADLTSSFPQPGVDGIHQGVSNGQHGGSGNTAAGGSFGIGGVSFQQGPHHNMLPPMSISMSMMSALHPHQQYQQQQRGSSLYDPMLLGRLLRDHPDRDEALIRYRQKRKTRHFEKTIRYATRQMRACKRPRDKGRFVKHGDPHDKDEGGHELDDEEVVGEISGAADADVEASGHEDEDEEHDGEIVDGCLSHLQKTLAAKVLGLGDLTLPPRGTLRNLVRVGPSESAMADVQGLDPCSIDADGEEEQQQVAGMNVASAGHGMLAAVVPGSRGSMSLLPSAQHLMMLHHQIHTPSPHTIIPGSAMHPSPFHAMMPVMGLPHHPAVPPLPACQQGLMSDMVLGVGGLPRQGLLPLGGVPPGTAAATTLNLTSVMNSSSPMQEVMGMSTPLMASHHQPVADEAHSSVRGHICNHISVLPDTSCGGRPAPYPVPFSNSAGQGAQVVPCGTHVSSAVAGQAAAVAPRPIGFAVHTWHHATPDPQCFMYTAASAPSTASCGVSSCGGALPVSTTEAPAPMSGRKAHHLSMNLPETLHSNMQVEGPVLSLLSVQGEGGSGASHHHQIVASQPALSQSCSCMEENEAPHSEGMGRGVMTGGDMEMDQPEVSLLQHADSVVRVAARKAERPSWAAVSTVNSCIDENNGPAVGMLLAGEGDDDDLEEAEVDSAEQPQVSGASNTLPAGGVVDLEVAGEVCVPLVMSSHDDKTKVAGPSFVGEVASKIKARGRTNNKGRLSMSGQSGHRGN